ncbi:tRNA 2-selenouridine(34) synthase MnmH [Neobacillus notoginsengisoli]|uniref:tRNA 2-selenouridine(34) synthase MnmH n=1 Tax=Neobacillus notoginsengisoli TaxID=1578198 RepID=A0A417YXH3_9BACI|nr:tRNA 2-selenouridine(34) synthase MnmH [Neobacillus notoginsengisoli]RHW42229.1 tRNA 2-selenouridine(34) synthase MnmH [Neobacillus notoginsengisoli]
MREITMEELNELKNPVIIDVRSPVEFKEGAIPGAINVPLFSDEERSDIGIIYKKDGSDAAKWKAMEIVSPKIPNLLRTIKEHTGPSGMPIIQCWRGGMRSKAVTAFLEFSGVSARRLQGGYKAFRQYSLKRIPELLPQKSIVIHGMTGTGKTEVLHLLADKGYPVIDLEHLAGHRGSIFGAIGLGEGNSQKTFDAMLYKRLAELGKPAYTIMEAESKRIGRIVQPNELMDVKTYGIHVQIHLPMEQRLKLIEHEYITPYEQEPWYHEKVKSALERIKKRIKIPEAKNKLEDDLDKKNYRGMIKTLLESYYDPMYEHKQLEYVGEFKDIYADSIEDAARKIEDYLAELSLGPCIVSQTRGNSW